jgi:hypothetical protein
MSNMGLIRFSVSPTAESRDAAGIEDYRKKSSIPVQQIRTISKLFDDRETDGDIAALRTSEKNRVPLMIGRGRLSGLVITGGNGAPRFNI